MASYAVSPGLKNPIRTLRVIDSEAIAKVGVILKKMLRGHG
jgi:hypothetical protein